LLLKVELSTFEKLKKKEKNGKKEERKMSSSEQKELQFQFPRN